MSLLDRKLIRDIAAMRGQVITIALVVAAGVAIFVSSVSTYDSLQTARDRFYGWARFPQLFVGVKRAPLSVVPRLADLPGVIAVEPRIVRDVLVDWPSSAMPISARMVSVTNSGEEMLSRLRLVRLCRNHAELVSKVTDGPDGGAGIVLAGRPRLHD